MTDSRVGLAAAALVLLAGCGSATRPPLTDLPSQPVRPAPVTAESASRGSLFPASGGLRTGYRPLFEDRRARAVGDSLTIVLNERTAASKKSSASAQKDTSVSGGVTAANKVPFGNVLQGLSLEAGSANKFEGKGASTAANDFTGTITVTVVEVLANGNLRVAGEKKLAVSYEEEVIRFSGIVNPADLVANTVSSTQVAETRIEYRGSGQSDDVQSAGWLTRLVLKAWPF